MPPAREQTEERRIEGIGLEVERCDVPLEMVHGHEWTPTRPGDCLRRRETDEQSAHEAGALCDRDPLDFP